MTEGNIRTISEMIERYTLEPEIFEIFVEGNRDYSFYNYFIKEIGGKNIGIYVIDTIELNEEDLNDLSLSIKKNNKNKVIALSHLLDKSMPDLDNVRCIVDSDFDLILKKKYNYRTLLLTDYTSLELYLFNKKVLRKFFDLAIGGTQFSISSIIFQFSEILSEIFLIRLANFLLEVNMEWYSIKKCCTFNDSEILFDSTEFLKRYLSKNSKLHLEENFIKIIENYRANLTDDPKKQIHRDDFFELMSLFLRKSCKFELKLSSIEFVSKSLFLCIEINQLLEENLFKKLKNWIEKYQTSENI